MLLIEQLDALSKTAEEQARAAIEFVNARKASFSITARMLRTWTLAFIAAGLLAPFVGGAFPVLLARIDFGGLGLLLIVVGGTASAIDRFGGFSSAWTRYAQLVTAIERDLATFQVEWAVEREEADLASPEDVSALADSLKSFTARMAAQRTAAQTPPWLTDFRPDFSLDFPAPARMKPKKRAEQPVLPSPQPATIPIAPDTAWASPVARTEPAKLPEPSS
jgi:hypothetical protein